MYSSMTPLRSFASLGDWVFTFIAGLRQCGAGGGRAAAAFHFDQAEAAGAEGFHAIGGAQFWAH